MSIAHLKGHIVTMKPPSECPSCSRDHGPEPVQRSYSDEELTERALHFGLDPGPYIRGYRQAEANAEKAS